METKPRILVVDDEEVVCVMTKRILEHDGFDVTVFMDSTRALAALEQEQFDVLITDLKMKDVDGMQLLDFTNKKWPETKVIVLTAFATTEVAAEVFDKKAFDYFTKPVRISDLQASVKRALEHK